ncbi:hypothetical protein [Embleya sp. AB8]|uniref:hypothetical protein n=1 Tax=Embleya sp. AB8 TaxID=3156304 RepID=UPI003C774B1D
MSEIRFTLSLGQRAMFLVIAASFVVLSGFEFAAGGDGPDGRYPLFLAFLFVLNFLVYSRVDTRITPQGITWRRYRAQHLDWSQVAHIRQRSLLGSRYIQVVRADGKVRSLSAPLDTLFQRDRDYDAKFATIRNAWAGATGRAPYLPGPNAPEHWDAARSPEVYPPHGA